METQYTIGKNWIVTVSDCPGARPPLDGKILKGASYFHS